MKKEKIVPFVMPLLYVVLGVLSFITAEQGLTAVCYVGSIVLVLWGLFSMIRYLCRSAAENFASNDFVIGFVFLLLGITAAIKADVIAQFIPFALGFLIAVNGIREFQNAIDVYKLNLHNQWIVVLIAAINLVLGIILMVNPGMAANVLMKVTGVGLIVSGVTDFVTTMVVLGKSRKEAPDVVKVGSSDVVVDDEWQEDHADGE